jgi:hypothetical protein
VDLNQRLAEIRQLQGKEPLPNPHRISGFGEPGDLPSPSGPVTRFIPPLPESRLEDDFGLEMDAEEPAPPSLPPSPLIPRKSPLTPSPKVPGLDFDLTELEESDLRAITEIVLKAKLRRIQGALAAVAAPRRLKKPGKASESTGTQEAVSVEPRKRGRPRKS